MGSNLIITKKTQILLPPTNATLFAKTEWDQCIPCRDYYGVTLYNVTINIANVTSPDPDAKTPSIAVFASQDLTHWYNAYHPKKLQDAYIDNWRHTEITLFNGTELACLGTVYRNYLVVCLNTQDLAATLKLGARIPKPPFNDLCFQMTGLCGIPCVSSEGAAEPEVCTNGYMDMNALGYNSTQVKKIDKTTAVWTSGLGWVEWIVLVTIFLDCFGNILRFFPALSGRPAELESARNCICEGNVILGCTSPFVSEDEAIFLRSLLGRTATVFHTIGGRHNLSGMYLDTILNEKRGKGEANRRHLWLSWIEFITILGRIGADDGYYDGDEEDFEEGDWEGKEGEEPEWDEEEDQNHDPSSSTDYLTPKATSRQSRNGSGRESLARQTSNASSTHAPRPIRRSRVASQPAFPRPSRTTLSQIPMSLRDRASIVDPSRVSQSSIQPTTASAALGNDFTSIRVNNNEVVNFDKRHRSNTVAGAAGGAAGGMRPSFRNHEIFSNLLEAKATQARMSQARLSMAQSPKFLSPPAAVVGSPAPGGPKIPNIPRRDSSQSQDESAGPQARAIDPFDAQEDLEFAMADLLPLVCFLDGWLEAVKDKEWTYNYRVKKDALDAIFNAAPLEVYFQGEDLLLAHTALKKLYTAFIGDVKDEKDHGMPIHPELYEEINWIICRPGLPDWTVMWSLMSRARLRPMSEKAMGNPPMPLPLFETTRVKPGAIVYQFPDPDLPPHDCPENWLAARAATYKVVQFERSIDGTAVRLIPWPEMKRPNGEPFDDRPPVPITVPLQDVSLVEQNRGKAGALNVYKDFLRTKGTQWAAEQGINGPVQIFMAIIDARHMLAEPEIFWNDGLPFFARMRSGASAKDYGEEHCGQQCIMVQYPQFFTNVTRDDFLDNKNSAYYTIWQTLRDCAKTITSSGTNAIWEITNPTFSYATTSRIEDTGTSQKYIPRYISVHLPCFVAYGIAKQTEDYIEAVYRWSTGAVELYWATFLSAQFSHYVLIFIISVIYALACFGASYIWYYVWLFFLLLAGIQATTDKANGRKPLRRPIVSSTIVMNTMYWFSNLVSTVWMVIIPVQIAFFNKVPLSQSVSRSLFWGFAAIILRTPPAIMTDRIANMCRFLSLKTDDWNYSMVLWRSSQLYSCSFAYSTLSIITGTGNAFKAHFFDADLTMWSSFRVSDAAFQQALDKIRKTESVFSKEFWGHVGNYLNLCFKSMMASFSMPDILTKWWALFLFTLQLTCIFVSMNITNRNDFTAIFITLIVCGLNTLLCIDITVLLCPSITLLIGRPARPEYIFAFLGATVVVTALIKGNTSLQDWKEIVKLTVSF